MICSPALVNRAVKKHHLDALRSLHNQDAAAAIMAGLKVLRADEGKSTDEAVLTLNYEGPDGEDCLKILAGIIESYQEFLGGAYESPNEEVIRLCAAKDTLHRQLTEKRKRVPKVSPTVAAAGRIGHGRTATAGRPGKGIHAGANRGDAVEGPARSGGSGVEATGRPQGDAAAGGQAFCGIEPNSHGNDRDGEYAQVYLE